MLSVKGHTQPERKFLRIEIAIQRLPTRSKPASRVLTHQRLLFGHLRAVVALLEPCSRATSKPAVCAPSNPVPV